MPDIDETFMQRHNVRPVPGKNTPAEPLYRTDALLIPTRQLGPDSAVIEQLNSALDNEGFGRPLVMADRGGLVTLVEVTNGDAAAVRDKLIELAPKPIWDDATVPVTIGNIVLDHVVITGMPVSKGFGVGGRVPLSVMAPPPCRRSVAELGTGRRPVVAILDTTVQEHPWFVPVPADDPVVVNPVDWIPAPANRAPLAEGAGLNAYGQLTTHAGHGTFVAGLLRQAAPDARILPLDVMHGDGAVYEHLLYRTLEWICDRVESGDPARFVDVLCLSLGYTDPADSVFTQNLRQLICQLGARGVRVVAAAGNHSEQTPTYPAAFATDQPSGHVGVVSVGALNPDGTPAEYSNSGDWVTDTAPGSFLVSTMPRTFDPDNSPRIDAFGNNNIRWYGMDVRDFSSGFGWWSGTSFAAAVFAGRLAQALVPEPDQTLVPEPAEAPADLLDVAPEAAIDRANRAYARVTGRL